MSTPQAGGPLAAAGPLPRHRPMGPAALLRASLMRPGSIGGPASHIICAHQDSLAAATFTEACLLHGRHSSHRQHEALRHEEGHEVGAYSPQPPGVKFEEGCRPKLITPSSRLFSIRHLVKRCSLEREYLIGRILWGAGGGAGDRDNAVYGQLYALDQASYSRHDPLGTSAGARARSGYAYGCGGSARPLARCSRRRYPYQAGDTLFTSHTAAAACAAAAALETCQALYSWASNRAVCTSSKTVSRRDAALSPRRRGEGDGDSQVGRAGRRQRYFLARVARREHDGTLRRMRYCLTTQVTASAASLEPGPLFPGGTCSSTTPAA